MSDPIVANLIQNLVPVITGWFLGLGSALLIDYRNRKKKMKATKNAIGNELREVAYRLLGITYWIDNKLGGFDRELLEWMLPQLRRYEGPNQTGRMMSAVAGLLNRSDAEIAQANEQLRGVTTATYCPVQEANYSSAVAAQAHDFDPEYALRLLDILSHIRMLNDHREQSLYYVRLTFTPDLGDDNYTRASQNAEVADRQIAKQARIIVDRITALEQT